MAKIIEITDLGLPELDAYARLTDPQLRSRREPEKGILIAESANVIAAALDAGLEPISLLMERRHLTGQGQGLMDRCGEIPVYTGDRPVLENLTGYALTRGILGAFKRPAVPEPETALRGARRVAVLEDIVDRTNMGALFRSAAALGMDALLLSPGCCDPLSRRALRVSMGTVFKVPWSRFSAWPEGGMDLLHREGFFTAALALDSRAVAIDSPALAEKARLALLLGTEGTGLSPRTIGLCDTTAVIPMHRGVDSLNVAAAGAVAFWQLGNREYS